MNHVTLIGRITRNLELRETNSGKHYVFFSIAINDMNNRTDFINCVAWNRVAENMTKFVGKGSLVAITGRLSSRKDNKGQYLMEVSANSVTFLDNRRKDFSDNTFDQPTEVSAPKSKAATNEVNIDEALNNSENYDTEISFVNNSNLETNDSDDDAIIWDD